MSPEPMSFDASVDSVKYASDDSLAIGTSHLTGPVWNGKVYVVRAVKGLPPENNVATPASTSNDMSLYLDTYSGNADVAWVGEKEQNVAIGTDDGSILVWDVTAGSEDDKCGILDLHDDVVTALSCCPTDRRRLVSASWDRVLRLSNLDTFECVRSFQGHTGGVDAVDWNVKSPHLVASASQDGSSRVWDVRKAECVGLVLPDGGAVPLLSAVWNPLVESNLALGSEDGTVRVYDWRSSKEPLLVSNVHQGAVLKLEFSPHDKDLLATASEDCTGVVISVLDASVRHTVRSHKDFVTAVAWSRVRPSVLATASRDQTVLETNLSLTAS